MADYLIFWKEMKDCTMEIRISNKLYRELCMLAEKAYPNECCAVLTGKPGEASETELLELPADCRRKSFQIEPMEFYRIEQELTDSGKDILGIFHSHPDAEAILSREDFRYMIPGMKYIILSCIDGRAAELRRPSFY